jgi:hypothetical protein
LGFRFCPLSDRGFLVFVGLLWDLPLSARVFVLICFGFIIGIDVASLYIFVDRFFGFISVRFSKIYIEVYGLQPRY